MSLIVLSASLAMMLLVTLRDPPKDDVAWLLYVAKQWLHGQRLYVDLVEVNPPLIIWLYAIPVLIAGWASMAPALLAMVMFSITVLACAWWTASIIAERQVWSVRLIVFSTIGTVLLLIPGGEFGQREHLLIALALPYLALLGNEISGGRAPKWHAICIGVLAALGCALKPRYLFAFGLVEVFAWFQGVRLLRPVSLAAAGTLVVYTVAVAAFAPAFFTDAVPMALALYSATDPALTDLLYDCRLLFFGVVTGLLLLAVPRGERAHTMRLAVLFIFAAGAAVVCIIQGKNWFYHRLPGIISSLLGLVSWLALRWRAGWKRDWRSVGLACLVAAVLAEHGVGVYERLRPELSQALETSDTVQARLARVIRREHAHSYVAFSEWIGLGFPVVDDTGVVWASRFDSMWALHAEDALGEVGGTSKGSKSDWPVARWVVQDFLHTCPDLVVVDLRGPENYIALLSGADPSFRKAWQLYRPIGGFDRLVIYLNRGTVAARAAAACGGAPVAVASRAAVKP